MDIILTSIHSNGRLYYYLTFDISIFQIHFLRMMMEKASVFSAQWIGIFSLVKTDEIWNASLKIRGVASGGAGGQFAPPQGFRSQKLGRSNFLKCPNNFLNILTFPKILKQFLIYHYVDQMSDCFLMFFIIILISWLEENVTLHHHSCMEGWLRPCCKYVTVRQFYDFVNHRAYASP